MKTLKTLKKVAASLSFESRDVLCPFGALSLNGATSLSSGTCKVFIFCIYCHAVHCARHFYSIFNLLFASVSPFFSHHLSSTVM